MLLTNLARNPKNCYRCGLEFAAGDSQRICPGCRKPKVRTELKPELSLRERQVVDLVCQAKLNKEIAWELRISEATVKTHLLHIFEKLGVADRTSAVTTALERGLIQLPRG